MVEDLEMMLDAVTTRGKQLLSGPHRAFGFGARTLEAIAGAADPVAALHARMRRVQYLPDSVFAATRTMNAAKRVAVLWQPELHTLLPTAHVIHLYEGPTVPFERLESLIAGVEWLDDEHVLVPPVSRGAEWAALVARASAGAASSDKPWWKFWG
jgi:hypothetical protein